MGLLFQQSKNVWIDQTEFSSNLGHGYNDHDGQVDLINEVISSLSMGLLLRLSKGELGRNSKDISLNPLKTEQ